MGVDADITAAHKAGVGMLCGGHIDFLRIALEDIKNVFVEGFLLVNAHRTGKPGIIDLLCSLDFFNQRGKVSFDDFEKCIILLLIHAFFKLVQHEVVFFSLFVTGGVGHGLQGVVYGFFKPGTEHAVITLLLGFVPPCPGIETVLVCLYKEFGWNGFFGNRIAYVLVGYHNVFDGSGYITPGFVLKNVFPNAQLDTGLTINYTREKIDFTLGTKLTLSIGY